MLFLAHERRMRMKLLGILTLLMGLASVLSAMPTGTPEIDPGAAGTAVALLSGSLLLLKGRRKQ